MRCGIFEEQSTWKETLKLCLDEIRACRPYFIVLLGERCGWISGYDAFTEDLRGEQPWIADRSRENAVRAVILFAVSCIEFTTYIRYNCLLSVEV
jgi:hypothetical protein